MKRKKVIIIIGMIVVLVLLYGIHSIFGNYRFGQELYRSACRLSFQVQYLIKSIDDLEEEFAEADNHPVDYVYYNEYYNAVDPVWFGYEDMPILDEVRFEYSARIDEIRDQTMKDEEVENAFTNAEEFQKIADLRDQLKVLTNGLNEFVENYRQMSDLERYFAPWKNELKLLTDKVRIP